MAKRWYLTILLGCLLQAGMAQQVLLDTVFFEYNSDFIKTEDKAELDSIAKRFLKFPTYYVEIFGHTDSIGSTAYNLELSERRAREVALYLIDQGVSVDRILYEGMGTTKPVASNVTYAGRKKNRRADVSIIFTKKVYTPPVVIDSSASQDVSNAEVEVVDPAMLTDTVYVDSSYESVDINPKRNNLVIAPQGTKFFIPAECFETTSDYLTVSVAELYSRRDVIVAGMPSSTRDGQLEAGAFIQFDVRDNRKSARFAEEKQIDVFIPYSRRDPYTGVYSGSGRVGRGGSRSRRGSRSQNAIRVPKMTAVKSWKEENYEVRYLGLDKTYTFQIDKPGKFALGRPLYYSQNTERDDRGIDIELKLKGKLYPKEAKVMVAGVVTKTYVAMEEEGKRIYRAEKVKFLNEDTELVLIAIQKDDKGNPYLAKLTFTPGYFFNRKKRKDPKKRPVIKLKTKIRRIDPDRLEELLTELNV